VKVRKSGDTLKNVKVIVIDAKGRVVARSRALKRLKGYRATVNVKRVRSLKHGRRYRISVVGVDPSGQTVKSRSYKIRA